MVALFPNTSALCQNFTPTSPYYKPTPNQEHPQKRRLFSAWSAVDTAKNKAAQLTDAASAELEKASHKAQAKAGQIELYSFKYYMACEKSS